ncbi:ADP-ribosylation/crystallin J1 [Hymenobacter fodinae]|uniref:ADP-ribosylation/crystallin J1 n=1 Tax=Hymenobacter fodinae TaxID=2510796 RepID=A0A4Z0P255_9BACT|nr:ADP-ribosylation/crystallin J1 [Hymenobacter fodinae]TGE05199.1 ADP-ribosylation/crystallin J1 [Hymenobacter fodinae]
MRHEPSALLLYWPVEQQEMDLIAASGWLAFPERRPEWPSFCPTLREEYAARLVHQSGQSEAVAYVLRFAVDAEYAACFPMRTTVGGLEQEALCVPEEELADFNQQLIGQIEIVAMLEGRLGH